MDTKSYNDQVEKLPNGMIRAYGTNTYSGGEPCLWRTEAVAMRAVEAERALGRAVTLTRHEVFEYDCCRDSDANEAGA